MAPIRRSPVHGGDLVAVAYAQKLHRQSAVPRFKASAMLSGFSSACTVVFCCVVFHDATHVQNKKSNLQRY